MRLHSLFLCSIGAEKHQGLGQTLSIKRLVKSDLNLLHEPFM